MSWIKYDCMSCCNVIQFKEKTCAKESDIFVIQAFEAHEGFDVLSQILSVRKLFTRFPNSQKWLGE